MTDDSHGDKRATTRYRLRYQLREVDLQRSITYVGRGQDCDIAFEDALVSQTHARILLDGDLVTIEDLASRNGVHVNGMRIEGPTQLRPGDRIRVGAQQLVLCRVQYKVDRRPKTTGVERRCGKCRTLYALEIVSCPTCGAVESADEPTTQNELVVASGAHPEVP